MSKITFRADDDLIRQIEAFDASKSEVMREALRAYLDEQGSDSSAAAEPEPEVGSLDELVAERVDALVAERLERSFTRRRPQDVNVNISLDGGYADEANDSRAPVNARADAPDEPSTAASNERAESKTSGATDENANDDDRKTCTQCGGMLSQSHVYCPNCGEKSARRAFCECGDELRTDWAFCPGCGRRTPAADVLD